MSFAWHEIRDHLMQTSSTLSFQRSFDTMRQRRKLLARFGDPASVLDALHRGAISPEKKNLLLRALVEVAQSDHPDADAALTIMLLALWPGLDAIRRRSIWRRLGASDEIASDILARSTEAIRVLDLDRVNWIAATILRNVERDIIRARQRETGRQSILKDTDPDEFPAERAAWQPTFSPALLHADLRRIIGADANLVMRVAVAGFTQAEMAVELGLSEAATRKRYQRATTRLHGALRENV